MSPKAISMEMIQSYINTLTSSVDIPEEKALEYFTMKEIKRLSTWDKWKAGEK